MASAVAETFATALGGCAVADVAADAALFIRKDPVGIRPFARRMLEIFERTRVRTVVISGAPQPLVEAAAQRYGFWLVYGTTFTARRGVYCGTVAENRAVAASKRRALRLLPGTVEVRVAVGDTDADLPLFEAAPIRIVVANPSLAARLPQCIEVSADAREIPALEQALLR